MPRNAARRCFLLHSGNARRKFSIAAQRNPGRTHSKNAAVRVPAYLARGRGIAPIVFQQYPRRRVFQPLRTLEL